MNTFPKVIIDYSEFHHADYGRVVRVLEKHGWKLDCVASINCLAAGYLRYVNQSIPSHRSADSDCLSISMSYGDYRYVEVISPEYASDENRLFRDGYYHRQIAEALIVGLHMNPLEVYFELVPSSPLAIAWRFCQENIAEAQQLMDNCISFPDLIMSPGLQAIAKGES